MANPILLLRSWTEQRRANLERENRLREPFVCEPFQVFADPDKKTWYMISNDLKGKRLKDFVSVIRFVNRDGFLVPDSGIYQMRAIDLVEMKPTLPKCKGEIWTRVHTVSGHYSKMIHKNVHAFMKYTAGCYVSLRDGTNCFISTDKKEKVSIISNVTACTFILHAELE